MVEKHNKPTQPITMVTISCTMPLTKCRVVALALCSGLKNSTRPANSPNLPGVKFPIQTPIQTDCHALLNEILSTGLVNNCHLKTSMPQFKNSNKMASAIKNEL